MIRNVIIAVTVALIAPKRILFALLCAFALSPSALASRPLWLPIAQDLTSIAMAPNGGFWVQVDQYAPYGNIGSGGRGRTVSVDNQAPVLSSVEDRGTIISPPGKNGYWVLEPKGKVYTVGDVPKLCDDLSDCAGFHRFPTNSEIVVGGGATPGGNGFWALDRGGRVFTVGDAVSYGDTQEDTQVATGFAPTPSGKGYYVVHEDGGVFSFGDAVFFGSTGGKKPGGHDVSGIALSLDPAGRVNGYYLTAIDGGVFTFGGAQFFGSTGGDNGGDPITGIISFPTPTPNWPIGERTRGYVLVRHSGNVIVFRNVN
jgi:hypothetical protein